MYLKKALFLSTLTLSVIILFSIYRSYALNKSITQLSLSDRPQSFEIDKESLKTLEDVYVDSVQLAPENKDLAPAQEMDDEKFAVEYCLEGDTTEKEKDLVKLNQLENQLFDTEELTVQNVELVRAKILAIKKTYKLPVEYSDKIRMEDFIALQLTNYTKDEYESLTHEERSQLISSLGGTQYLRDSYIKNELEGRKLQPPTDEHLKLRDQEDELHSLLDQSNHY